MTEQSEKKKFQLWLEHLLLKCQDPCVRKETHGIKKTNEKHTYRKKNEGNSIRKVGYKGSQIDEISRTWK